MDELIDENIVQIADVFIHIEDEDPVRNNRNHANNIYLFIFHLLFFS